ncbi:hypothetical protein BO94DRAFT_533881 [Aspergillus sclerotioniger CBS 115572]|uniref:Uncharacterized protein n=1 Tax=Aspergillus sclerotioniger CBS 115572 TaxID=1450535 RepID=A0A317WYI3_9EURO|nr:hypothetical protein BO94DRAFT_533881 [Aspergillus sclerotioniger CBS 115572]PWY90392.1 hypothetical protein BO94DRAFT_533881 [Aspergillus sclerotioniger CBS 115572]
MRPSILLTTALSLLLTTTPTTAKDTDTTTVLGVFSPSWDAEYQKYGGWTSTGASIANLNAVKTTFEVGCLKDAPKTDCDMKKSYTIVQGPETVSVSQVYTASTSDAKSSYDLTLTRWYECSMKSYTEDVTCTMSVDMTGSADGATVASSTSAKSTYKTATSSFYSLVVTGGLKSLTAPAATETAGGAGAGPVAAMITAAPVAAVAVVAALV